MNYLQALDEIADKRDRDYQEKVQLLVDNVRLREAIKAAMREIVNEDYDEAYHQLYAALDPKFENLFGVDIEKAV